MDDADRMLVQRLRSSQVLNVVQGLVDLLAAHPAVWPLNADAQDRLYVARRAIDNILIEDRKRRGEGAAMRDGNVITVNEMTLCEMIRDHFVTTLFRVNEAPRVMRVQPVLTSANEWVFEIITDGPAVTKKVSNG